MGNIYFERFYYWLSPTTENKKALLGDDFIKNCEFGHKIRDNIVIDDFGVAHDLCDPRIYTKQTIRDQFNLYMRTVMREEPLDPTLEVLQDDAAW
ncbi:MAG: hypothetical protein K6B14_08165 [Lachnospiraceae bacterium]|nr:hypothetical protein [Lachnospiraceae bacterium]